MIAGLRFRKRPCNELAVIEDILNEGRPFVFEINKDVCQRLGVMCAAGRDVFTSQVGLPRKRPIERNVLSAISSLFDTLEFLQWRVNLANIYLYEGQDIERRTTIRTHMTKSHGSASIDPNHLGASGVQFVWLDGYDDSLLYYFLRIYKERTKPAPVSCDISCRDLLD